MSLANMRQLGPMVMPGANEYGDRFIDLAWHAEKHVRVKWDVPYGAGEFQKLDIWMPNEAQNAPVVLFIHGGAFRKGHKEWIGAQAPAITAAGAILVSPDYRLVPWGRIGDAVDDCFQALSWIFANIAAYGGDPCRIILSGHSAGGYLAAMLSLRSDRLQAIGGSVNSIRACMPVSGVFNCTLTELAKDGVIGQSHRDYFNDESEGVAASIYAYVNGSHVPFFIAYGDRDLQDVIVDNERLVADLSRAGTLIGMEKYLHTDHFGAHEKCLDPAGPWFLKLRQYL